MSDSYRKDDAIVDQLLARPESLTFDCKRIGKVDKILHTIVAFANTQGGIIALGLEDPDKAQGRARVLGIQANLVQFDELKRKITTRITESDQLIITIQEVGCTLVDGSDGVIAIVKVTSSRRVHSIVDNGTFVRLDKSNKELTATEILKLMYDRGVISAESQLEDIDFQLLDTQYWAEYSGKRRLTRPIDLAMYHIGLARKDQHGTLKPLRAAVLLFAEDPSGLLASKATVRIFHYRGHGTSNDPNTNLVRPPTTIGGPLIRQIRDSREAIINELAGGIQYGPLGFEIIQKYPVRVIAEAVTNAVIHRDYSLQVDTIVKIFSDRIEIESPGLLIGPVRAANIMSIGSYARNSLIVQHLREFPNPPNLDAGEGVPMMFGTMHDAGLYPPLYITRPRLARDAVRVFLLNEHRPTVWQQVSEYLDEYGTISNSDVRKLKQTQDTLGVSKLLKSWVEQGLLEVANPEAGRNVRRYRKPSDDDHFFSNLLGKEPERMP